MGLHWLDIASPELNGAEFRYTLFYGSWDGRIIFDEPMITKALLELWASRGFKQPITNPSNQ